jgi:hypothetical protein
MPAGGVGLMRLLGGFCVIIAYPIGGKPDFLLLIHKLILRQKCKNLLAKNFI